MSTFIVREHEGIRTYAPCTLFDANLINVPHSHTRFQILSLLSIRAAYTSDIASALKIPVQQAYYHVRALKPFLETVATRKVRGVIAHQYRLQSNILCFPLHASFNSGSLFTTSQIPLSSPFFKPFITDGYFNGKIVVGSPDPHGPFKARARDGHYAIDLALFLGSFARLSEEFSVNLDVDMKLKEIDANVIVVGGPVTNLVMSQLNDVLPVSFIEQTHWAIKGLKRLYVEENVGLICRVPHPFFPQRWVICIAGIRFSGTKAAVIGLTRMTKLVLAHFTNQKKFYAIIQGFDLDGDGKIDSVDLLESS